MAIGISPAYMSLIELGKRPVPSNFLEQLTEILKLTDGEIISLGLAIAEGYALTSPFRDIDAARRRTLSLVNKFFVQIKSGVFARECIHEIVHLLEEANARGVKLQETLADDDAVEEDELLCMEQ